MARGRRGGGKEGMRWVDFESGSWGGGELLWSSDLKGDFSSPPP